MTTETPVTSPAFRSGHRARLENRYRVLCCPRSDEELAEWQSGWDAADAAIVQWWNGLLSYQRHHWLDRAHALWGQSMPADAFRLAHRIASAQFPLPPEAP